MLIVGVSHLAVCLLFLILASYINIEMWLIALICAGSLFLFTFAIALVRRKDWYFVEKALKRLPYPLAPFFLSMFVIVVALNHQGISSEIAKFFGSNFTIWIYGYTSFFTCNIINNIPMSILYSNLCSQLTPSSYMAGVFASIIGSNIGAFLTPMGALAGIMFTNLLNEHNIHFSFVDFMKYGLIISLPTITVALSLLLVSIQF